jgi:hypothetical protein
MGELGAAGLHPLLLRAAGAALDTDGAKG